MAQYKRSTISHVSGLLTELAMKLSDAHAFRKRYDAGSYEMPMLFNVVKMCSLFA